MVPRRPIVRETFTSRRAGSSNYAEEFDEAVDLLKDYPNQVVVIDQLTHNETGGVRSRLHRKRGAFEKIMDRDPRLAKRYEFHVCNKGTELEGLFRP